MQDQKTKQCPYCSEEILAAAIKCKHCGTMLSERPSSVNYDPFTFIKMSLINKYEIIEEIGHGGMASVYQAVQKNLERTVALKIVHQNLVHDKEFIGRFHREAQLSASLNHPNIVTVFDEGIENSVHFISMEFLDGVDLHNIIQSRGKLGVQETIDIITSIASAIDYANSKGLVHRDIKCSNIIVTSSGRAVLTDFGIARALTGSKLTQTGTVIGTPEYMSPEQAEGKQVDVRSDLYSLGIVMYECLTGTVPFRGDNPVTTIHKIIYEDLEPDDLLNNSLPTWLNSIVIKSISKNIDNRFARGIDLANALKNQKQFEIVQPIIISSDKKTARFNNADIKNKPIADLDNKKPSKVREEISKSSFPKLFNLTNIIILFGVILTVLIVYVLYSRLSVEQTNEPVIVTSQEQQSQIPQEPETNEKNNEEDLLEDEEKNKEPEIVPEVVVAEEDNEVRVIKQPQIVKVTVPNIKGLPLDFARNILKVNKLKVGIISYLADPKNIGTVINQIPKKGTLLNKNSKVNMIVGE